MVLSGFDGEDIRLESGLCLSSLSSVQKIHINVGRTEELSEEDVIGLINYGIKSLKFKALWLGNCKLPSSIKPDIIPEEASSRNVKGQLYHQVKPVILISNLVNGASLMTSRLLQRCVQVICPSRRHSESVQRSVIESWWKHPIMTFPYTV
ncbi:hypothetical protein BSL78_20295 [Apostichopus japonicus]|uniref:Uncharacterized protein n=1 Tax=Stichopus japonicus TaxID=307972 RepID=A0A2G8K4C0_STIJA|nr:hypothetical protein BSL78_20295 [Apostichopus japonicus]